MKTYEKKRKAPNSPLMNFDLGLAKVVKPQTEEEHQIPKAIIYVRVSSDRQVKEGHGLEGQEESCRNWCRLNEDIEVLKVFKDEAITGKNLNRKGLIDSIEFLEKVNKKYTKITHFVCTELGRIARPEESEDGTAIITRIEATGAKVVTTIEVMGDTSTDEGKLMNDIKFCISSYERKKIMKRAKNGRISRALQGYRPFPSVPVGYRKEGQGKDLVILKDEAKAKIVAEGLELFASNVLITRTDLLEFFRDSGLTTNEKNYKGKLWSSFIEKTFFLHRLFFYAGYIFYPEWDINEPIEGKHPEIVSLSVIYKVIEKLQKGSLLPRKPRKVEMTTDFPLRGVIHCPACHRKLTSWYSKSGSGKQIPYYGCSYKDCNKRENIPKETLESDFKLLLDTYKLPEDFVPVFKIILKEERDKSKESEESSKEKKLGMKTRIENRMKNIWDKMLETKNNEVYRNLERERAELNSEAMILEEDLNSSLYTEKEYLDLFDKTIGIISNPLAFWELGTTEIKELLLAVWFGGKLYYNKKSGYRTNDTGLLNYILKGLHPNDKPSIRRAGVRTQDLVLKRDLL